MIKKEEAKVYASRGRELITGRQPMLQMWQTLAENFYVEQADFTRELADMLAMTLRPEGKRWFDASTDDYDELSDDAKKVLSVASNRLYKLMYNKRSGFSAAMGLNDRSIAAFGNTVSSCEPSMNRRYLLFKSWHLKDVAWEDNYDGTQGAVFRRWLADPQEVIGLFPETVSQRVRDMIGINSRKGKGIKKETVEIYHCFMETEQYMGSTKANQKKYTSLFYDMTNNTVLKCIDTDKRFYSIARWARRWGSQYGYSRATERSLPDARMSQDMSEVLIRAGQVAVEPPTIEKAGAIRGDSSLYAGNMITIDPDYDEKISGDAIRVMEINGRNIPFGLEIMRSTTEDIDVNHYRGMIGLPPLDGGMSPYETSERIADYLRKAAPLIAPLEVSYSNDICDLAWDVALKSGLLFKDNKDIPEELLDKEIDFDFKNPLLETARRAYANSLSQALGTVAQVAQFDESFVHILDYPAAGRKALEGTIGVEALNSAEFIAEKAQAEAQAQQMAEGMAQAQQAAGLVKEGSEAAIVAAEAGNALGGLGEM